MKRILKERNPIDSVNLHIHLQDSIFIDTVNLTVSTLICLVFSDRNTLDVTGITNIRQTKGNVNRKFLLMHQLNNSYSNT